MLLVAPRPLLRVVAGRAPDERSVRVARVLGARHLIQAAVTGPGTAPAVLAAGAVADGLHSATAVALATVDRSRARSALVDAVVAATWCAVSARVARRTRTAGRRR